MFETIFKDYGNGVSINSIIDFILIILVFGALNFVVFWFLKRKTVRTLTVAISALSILFYILKFNFAFYVIVAILFGIVIISFMVNLAEIRNKFANKFTPKANSLELAKKNEVDKIFDHDSLYNTINETVLYLSRHKIGAIMTFEKKDKLDSFMKNGTKLDAPVNFELLITIFYPGTRLHDGAVIIRGNKIIAASVYYSPTTKPLIGKYGSRHRASIGISEVCDAVTIVVSEETGRVSIAYDGEIQSYPVDTFIKVFENLMNEDNAGVSLATQDDEK